ncbi:hypothetical protein AB0C59_10470 [Streptomyces sp. NPDC048664]|uniref:hypothetical protein n=1 Tax=Streptomyces sp. NPDC048664 TaxID=3154505 RepID=UPI00341D711F
MGRLPGSQQSLLLIKPDGVSRRLQPFILDAVRDAGLTVLCHHRILLDEDDIRRAFADMRRGENPLEHLTLDLWYAHRPMEVIVVSGGGDTVETAAAVKRKARAAYRLGVWANVVHTPDHWEEFALQLSVFGQGCADCRALLGGTDFGDYEDVAQAYPPGILLPPRWRDPQALRAVVEPMWGDASSCVWRPTYPPLYEAPHRADAPREHVVCVTRSPNQLSFDNLVAAVMAALPGMDFPQAFEVIFSSLHHAEFPLAAGTAAECEKYAAALWDTGLRTVVRALDDDFDYPAPDGPVHPSPAVGRVPA